MAKLTKDEARAFVAKHYRLTSAELARFDALGDDPVAVTEQLLDERVGPACRWRVHEGAGYDPVRSVLAQHEQAKAARAAEQAKADAAAKAEVAARIAAEEAKAKAKADAPKPADAAAKAGIPA